MQAAVLPPAYGEAFSTLYDEAPQISYEDVEAVFKRDFGKLPDEIFDVFEREARASASIATVFKARLKSGEWVAVKVQKPEIEKQVQVNHPTGGRKLIHSGTCLLIGLKMAMNSLTRQNTNVYLRSMVV